jgi:hypothetical protein
MPVIRAVSTSFRSIDCSGGGSQTTSAMAEKGN